MQDRITYWQKELGIPEWEITTERISPEQVTYPKVLICDKSFIGITRNYENKTATIYHDVNLYEDAIIHELLHVRYPTRSEDWVNKKTVYVQKERYGMGPEAIKYYGKKYESIQRCKKCGLEMSLIHSRSAGNCSPKKKRKKWTNSYI